MPIPPDFADESLYDPSVWYIHDVLEIDREHHRIVAVIDTTKLDGWVKSQRPWAGHQAHMPGAVAIQVTGTLGNLHAVYVLGLRMTEGWVGFGTHIRQARFRRMGAIGPPILAKAQATRRREFRGTWFVDYQFQFEQQGEPVYESEQTAAWSRQWASPDAGTEEAR